MNDSQFEHFANSLKRLENKLDILITLQKSSVKRPEVSGEEKNILKLCNGKHTIQDIANKTNKTINNVKVTLAHLKKKGLIISTKIKNKLVYVKL
jgi:DNA-binding MarR family transcriptional regulator